jgi:fermentation-respiration switch protein FrsA (DUF1100 family)
MRHPVAIIALAAGAYFALCLLAYVFQRRLVFFPDRKISASPAALGMAYRDVSFRATDGVELHGWYVPASGASRVVLVCHGNGGNISDRLESIRIFHDLGLSILIFDYRGYGRSGGQATEQGTYEDARAAYRHLMETEGVRPERIVFFGESLGGAVAVELATHHTPAALIVESCFPTLADVGARAYPFLPVRSLLRIRYDSRERIRRVGCPKLVIHSRDDEIVPFDLGTRLYDGAPPPKEFLEIRGGHNTGFIESNARYREGLDRFLRALG